MTDLYQKMINIFYDDTSSVNNRCITMRSMMYFGLGYLTDDMEDADAMTIRQILDKLNHEKEDHANCQS